jgi:hypothetical protein
MNTRLGKVMPNVKDKVPREFGNIKKQHDDGELIEGDF